MYKKRVKKSNASAVLVNWHGTEGKQRGSYRYACSGKFIPFKD
jgi:hypothetical protein